MPDIAACAVLCGEERADSAQLDGRTSFLGAPFFLDKTLILAVSTAKIGENRPKNGLKLGVLAVLLRMNSYMELSIIKDYLYFSV